MTGWRFILEYRIINSEIAAMDEISFIVKAAGYETKIIAIAAEAQQAQAVRDVSFAVYAPVNSFDLVDALVKFCIGSDRAYRFDGYAVDVASGIDTMSIIIKTRIYTKG